MAKPWPKWRLQDYAYPISVQPGGHILLCHASFQPLECYELDLEVTLRLDSANPHPAHKPSHTLPGPSDLDCHHCVSIAGQESTLTAVATAVDRAPHVYPIQSILPVPFPTTYAVDMICGICGMLTLHKEEELVNGFKIFYPGTSGKKLTFNAA